MDVCHSSPAWVGYGSQGAAGKTAKPGYISRAWRGTWGGFQKYADAVLWHGLEV